MHCKHYKILGTMLTVGNVNIRTELSTVATQTSLCPLRVETVTHKPPAGTQMSL